MTWVISSAVAASISRQRDTIIDRPLRAASYADAEIVEGMKGIGAERMHGDFAGSDGCLIFGRNRRNPLFARGQAPPAGRRCATANQDWPHRSDPISSLSQSSSAAVGAQRHRDAHVAIDQIESAAPKATGIAVRRLPRPEHPRLGAIDRRNA